MNRKSLKRLKRSESVSRVSEKNRDLVTLLRWYYAHVRDKEDRDQ